MTNDMKGIWDGLARQNAVSAVCWHMTEEQLDESGRIEAQYLYRVMLANPLCREPFAANVLDLGAGIGRIARHLAPLVGSYVLADVSSEMLVRAQRRCTGIPQCQYVELPGYGLDVLGHCEPFAFALCDLVMQHLDRELQVKYLSQLRRLMLPGGWVWFYVPAMRYPGRWVDMDRGDFPANIRRWVPGELLEVCVRLGWRVVAADLDSIQMVLENGPVHWKTEADEPWLERAAE